jgi:hypothetical protein
MFDYLTQLLFSNPEDEGEEMDNLDEDPVDEDIVSDDSNCESGDDEEEEYKDDYSEYFPDSDDSESEEELCCKCECFRESRNEDDTPADKTSEAKAEEKLSNSV